MTLRPAQPDPLTDALQRSHLRAARLVRLELGAPWGFSAGGEGSARFYVVTRGAGWMEVAGQKRPIPFAGGDLLLFPRTSAHRLYDSDRGALRRLDELVARAKDSSTVRAGGRGPTTSILAGWFTADGAESSCQVVGELPSVVHVTAEQRSVAPGLAETLEQLSAESARTAPGREFIVSRLCEVLFVHALRALVAGRTCPNHGWLRALTDEHIGRALAIMHEQLHRPWTVASLARAAGQSRSAFAARFQSLTGESPLARLRTLRLETAARLLADEQLSVDEVAERVGYRAGAAFARAFAQWSGQPPGSYRRARRELAPR
jgi:AraC-like DNA-binding protein